MQDNPHSCTLIMWNWPVVFLIGKLGKVNVYNNVEIKNIKRENAQTKQFYPTVQNPLFNATQLHNIDDKA